MILNQFNFDFVLFQIDYYNDETNKNQNHTGLNLN